MKLQKPMNAAFPLGMMSLLPVFFKQTHPLTDQTSATLLSELRPVRMPTSLQAKLGSGIASQPTRCHIRLKKKNVFMTPDGMGRTD